MHAKGARDAHDIPDSGAERRRLRVRATACKSARGPGERASGNRRRALPARAARGEAPLPGDADRCDPQSAAGRGCTQRAGRGDERRQRPARGASGAGVRATLHGSGTRGSAWRARLASARGQSPGGVGCAGWRGQWPVVIDPRRAHRHRLHRAARTGTVAGWYLADRTHRPRRELLRQRGRGSALGAGTCPRRRISVPRNTHTVHARRSRCERARSPVLRFRARRAGRPDPRHQQHSRRRPAEGTRLRDIDTRSTPGAT